MPLHAVRRPWQARILPCILQWQFSCRHPFHSPGECCKRVDTYSDRLTIFPPHKQILCSKMKQVHVTCTAFASTRRQCQHLDHRGRNPIVLWPAGIGLQCVLRGTASYVGELDHLAKCTLPASPLCTARRHCSRGSTSCMPSISWHLVTSHPCRRAAPCPAAGPVALQPAAPRQSWKHPPGLK